MARQEQQEDQEAPLERDDAAAEASDADAEDAVAPEADAPDATGQDGDLLRVDGLHADARTAASRAPTTAPPTRVGGNPRVAGCPAPGNRSSTGHAVSPPDHAGSPTGPGASEKHGPDADAADAAIVEGVPARRAGVAAGVGAAAVGLAVFAVAYFLQPSLPFPPLGIAQRVLRLIPGPVAVTFIELLGRWALRLFVTGTLAATVALGGALGAWAAAAPRPAKRRERAWLAGGLLAVLALAGYDTQPGSPALTVFVAVAVVAGAAYALVLNGACERLTRPQTAAGAASPTSRRELLQALLGAGGLLALGLAARGVLSTRGPEDAAEPLVRPAGAEPVTPATIPPEPAAQRTAFEGIDGLTPEITPDGEHYTVDEAIIDPNIDADSWRLRVDGLVGSATELSRADLAAMASIEQVVTLTCISNLVGGDLAGTARWTGVPLRDVLERAGGLADGAVRVVFHDVTGYTDSVPVAKALEPTTVVAYGMNGRALPRRHGHPARMIIPGIYGMKNVKWLERIEVVDYEYEGYWQAGAGWDNVAEIQTASRVDVPDGRADTGGELLVAGVAWAGDRGVNNVEVSADGGRTWTDAELRRELAPAAWRQWRARLRPPGDGELHLRVRATDGTGRTQTEARAPAHPSGATGYHEVTVEYARDA